MDKKVNKVLIGGGSGLIGTQLRQTLETHNIPYAILTRNPKEHSMEAYEWDTKSMKIDRNALKGVSHIINLAGAGIADQRWTEKRKSIIIESRVKSTQLLGELLANSDHFVERFISASAVGYYGDSGQELVDESSDSGDGFLADSVKEWETSVDQFIPDNIMTLKVRTGVVLTKDGGPIERMLPGLKLGVAPYFGNGKQMMPWIHIEDIAEVYYAGLTSDLGRQNIVNAVAPKSISSKEFADKIKSVKKLLFPIVPAPAWALRIVLGEMVDVVLNSNRVDNKVLRNMNFQYKYGQIEKALEDILLK